MDWLVVLLSFHFTKIGIWSFAWELSKFRPFIGVCFGLVVSELLAFHTTDVRFFDWSPFSPSESIISITSLTFSIFTTVKRLPPLSWWAMHKIYEKSNKHFSWRKNVTHSILKMINFIVEAYTNWTGRCYDSSIHCYERVH